jgi:hypothetical protein
VAGPRESEAPGIGSQTEALLREILGRLGSQPTRPLSPHGGKAPPR